MKDEKKTYSPAIQVVTARRTPVATRPSDLISDRTTPDAPEMKSCRRPLRKRVRGNRREREMKYFATAETSALRVKKMSTPYTLHGQIEAATYRAHNSTSDPRLLPASMSK